MQDRTFSLPTLAIPGAVAGLVGGIAINGYLLLTLVAVGHVTTVAGFYQYIASGLLGKAAAADPNGIFVGAAIHVAVAIGWGIGYAYVAARTPQVLTRPWISGAVFGALVMIAMQLVEVSAGIYVLPDSLLFFNLLLAHVAFYGLPIAFIVRRGLIAART